MKLIASSCISPSAESLRPRDNAPEFHSRANRKEVTSAHRVSIGSMTPSRKKETRYSDLRYLTLAIGRTSTSGAHEWVVNWEAEPTLGLVA